MQSKIKGNRSSALHPCHVCALRLRCPFGYPQEDLISSCPILELARKTGSQLELKELPEIPGVLREFSIRLNLGFCLDDLN